VPAVYLIGTRRETRGDPVAEHPATVVFGIWCRPESRRIRLTPFLDDLEVTGPMKPRCSELSHVMGLLGAVVLGLVGMARADIPGYEQSEFKVSMRDGVRLHTLVYRPVKQEGSLPIVLMRTPYGIAAGAPRALDDYLKDLAEEGYIFAFQDIRGRYKSEGVFVMIRPPRGTAEAKAIDEGTDAFDTIDWLVKNLKGNNGRVGMLGISYPGWLTVMALLEPHPALKAASPQAPPADMFLGDDFHHNGAFRLSYGFEYAALMETSKENTIFTFDRRDTFEWYLRLGPLSSANARYLKGKIPTWNDFVEHPSYDEFWRRQAAAPYLGRTRVPTLNVADWWDQEDFYGPLKVYEGFENPQPIQPDRVEEYTIDLHWNDHCFKKGHKIMAQIQSTWIPLIDRNPQIYVPNIFKAEAKDFRPATQRVFRSPGHSSYIEMSILGK